MQNKEKEAFWAERIAQWRDSAIADCRSAISRPSTATVHGNSTIGDGACLPKWKRQRCFL